ncbi:Aldo/keto reductase [Rhizoclosmatium globosum]|uniref:Aldo/keto reductase n=1 Tax=Rhizoclosmatium globosum TaxID=329046 RepID=A0A1Y2C4N1_9FUNG|nr:Aldo/keto reductase [Rhizoclosmatium globosum]|eukprot:ORY41992.1 Aldo/keto reductase [Rhizoclosmatium globosum]
MTVSLHTITLNDGTIVPKLAYGTGTKWGKRNAVNPDAINPELVESILTALRAGFSHIDTAEGYGTEPEVGLAVGQYLKETGKPRSSVFITTKVDFGPDSVVTIKQVWRDLEELVDAKLTRSIGVSNWRIQNQTKVNQIEFHAYNQGLKLREFADKEIGTTIAAYGPLQPLIHFAETGRVQAVVNKIAERKGDGVTGSQVLLAWGWAVGTIQITTSSGTLDLVLTDDEVEEISNAGAEYPNQRKFAVGKVFDD